jgi:hypothetical protein
MMKAYWDYFLHPTRQFMAGSCAGFGFGLMIGSGPNGSFVFGLIGGALIGVGGWMAVADSRATHDRSSGGEFTKT